MKLLYSGQTQCDAATLKRLLILADEICFMDRPSIVFGDFATVGRPSHFRRVDSSGSPVAISVHSPPSGPNLAIYTDYAKADLASPVFLRTVLEGFGSSQTFAGKFLQLGAKYSDTVR